jgi:hypothetical protein
MTEIPEFHRRVTLAMQYLDTRLPPRSKEFLIKLGWVFFTGLFNGELMFDYMRNYTHPLAGITYETMWQIGNMFTINPCNWWLSVNQTQRFLAARRAQELSEQYNVIVNSQRYNNFRMAYLGRDFFKTNLEDHIR